MATPTRQRAKVFISYSHKDAYWRDRLQVHLKPLEREGKIELWDDTKIGSGDDWREEIDQALREAKIAVLLISADFLYSDFIAYEELPPLLERAEAGGTHILPVILSPSRFERTPRLRRLQSVNPPSQPLNSDEVSAVEKEAFLVQVANRIEEKLGFSDGRSETPKSEAEQGEGHREDPWIVKTLDHTEQLKHLRPRLSALDSPAVAVVEGGLEDWPNYLADDVFLEPWPALDDCPRKAMTLNPISYGEDEYAFWRAAHRQVPAPQQAAEPGREQETVRAWLREGDCHLFYVSVSMVKYGRRLPRLIQGAQTFLDQLSSNEPRMRLLLLIACLPKYDRPPWWWSLWSRYCRLRLPHVLWLDPLQPLEDSDLLDWVNGIPPEARRILNRDQLRAEFVHLFQDGAPIRYHRVRQHLLEEGRALERARFRY